MTNFIYDYSPFSVFADNTSEAIDNSLLKFTTNAENELAS